MKITKLLTIAFFSLCLFPEQLLAHDDCNYKAALSNKNSYSNNENLDQAKTQSQFEEINNRVVELFKNEINSMGINFHLQNQWSSNSKNAASLKLAENWSIQMNGAIYKDIAITNDAQAMVTCHELGHLIGGAPYKRESDGSKMSTEGQADFWASAVCFKRYAKAFPLTQSMTNNYIKNICENNYLNNPMASVNDCYRTMMAGDSLAHFFSRLENENKPFININSKIKSIGTNLNHPDPQCRLDTFKAAALCDIGEVISTNIENAPEKMNCLMQNELVNKRPDCWFDEHFYTWDIKTSRVSTKETLVTIKMANNKSGQYIIVVNSLDNNSTIQKNEILHNATVSMRDTSFNFKIEHLKIHSSAPLQLSIAVYLQNKKIRNDIISLK